MEALSIKDKKSINILLVDDEQDILDFLQYNLEKEGFQIYTANNGQLAVEMFQKVKPALILSLIHI